MKVVAEAKEKHKKRHVQGFPQELQVKFDGCEVFASAGTRQIMIRVDDVSVKWIREGFQQTFEKHIEAEMGAVKAMSQPLIACGQEKVSPYSGMCLGVRDKTFWMPEKRCWALNHKLLDPEKNIRDFCRQESLCLSVQLTVFGEDFRKARDEALLDACRVWNALGKSGKQRIKLPAKTESCPVIQVGIEPNGNGSGGSDTESVSDAGSDDEAYEATVAAGEAQHDNVFGLE